ncbi:MAG: hypothetical protein Q8S20_02880 [Sulfuritalea sp.]|nr:hypothetical protein [Sulfuritalea sp.]
MDALPIFLRQVRSRSEEHQHAMRVLARERLAGQMVAVLRQELDSMVRVIYLLTQSAERRTALIEASVRGEKWSQPNSHASVTDKEMVDLAQNLQGWTLSVYKFGCAFIHLSGLHDYNDRDPLEQLPHHERKDILDHCCHYHGGPHGSDAKFSELVPYLPSVLEKIAGNLECYLEDLEKGLLPNAAEV